MEGPSSILYTVTDIIGRHVHQSNPVSITLHKKRKAKQNGVNVIFEMGSAYDLILSLFLKGAI